MSQPQVIVSAMRAGAREYIERPTTTTELLEAFIRLSTAQRKVTAKGLAEKSLPWSTPRAAAEPPPQR